MDYSVSMIEKFNLEGRRYCNLQIGFQIRSTKHGGGRIVILVQSICCCLARSFIWKFAEFRNKKHFWYQQRNNLMNTALIAKEGLLCKFIPVLQTPPKYQILIQLRIYFIVGPRRYKNIYTVNLIFKKCLKYGNTNL